MSNQFNQCFTRAPISLNFFCGVIALMTAIFMLLLLNGRYGKQEDVKGLIRSESFYRLTAEKPGNVSAIYVNEGDSVNPGDAIFSVALLWQNTKDHNGVGNMAEETTKRLNETLVEFETERKNQSENHDQLLIQKESYFNELTQSIAIAENAIKDYYDKKRLYATQLRDLTRLYKDNAITKTEVENTRQLIIENELGVKKSEVEKSGLLQTKIEKEIHYAKLEQESLQRKNDISRKIREIGSELNNIRMRQEYIVTSPIKGIVHDMGILKGDFIDGRTLTPSVILKENIAAEPVVVLQLSSKQIGLISPGEKVFVRVDTFPYESYGVLAAKVINISTTPTRVSVDDKESWFRVKLNILANDKHNKIPMEFLADGMTVSASLRQPKQTLIEWLFLPVKQALKRNPDYIHAEK